MDNSIISYLIIILLIIIIVFIAHGKVGKSSLVYVRSDIDGEYYMVRERPDKQKAANLLAKIKQNIFKLTDYLYNKINDPKTSNEERYKINRPYILLLKERIQNVVIKESTENTVYTSYTVNKGEQIIFCIRSKDISRTIKSNDMHDLNLMMYVALHEISHVACPEQHHTPLFKRIFRFICEEAINIGMYIRIDYRQNPTEYCGMTINETIV
jgi:hypothetical protein